MAARLKSRERFPPGEFQILLSQTGMEKPVRGSFAEVVTAFSRIVEANPSLAVKHGWPLERAAQEDWVDAREAQRMLAHGWTGFVEDGDPASGEVRPARRGLRASARNVAAGANLLVEWLGSAQKPVSQELAEKRASVCKDCPRNDGGDWKSYFTTPLANRTHRLLEEKHKLKLRTPLDDELTVCSACDCPLSLKIWTPLDIIVANTNEDVWPRFDPGCWLLAESGRKLEFQKA